MNRILFLSVTMMLAVDTFCQEIDSLIFHSYDLDEIVVRSFKQDKALKELPMAVSRVSNDVIRTQHLNNTKELSAVIPNLYIPDYGSKYTSPVYIRGIGSKNGTPSIGMYVDGIPFFEKSTFDFNLSEIESIEVYRGPQGTLYGRNSMGGIINIVTCSPLKHERNSLKIDGGSYHEYRIAGSHYHKVTDRLGYAVSGNYQHDGGFFTNTFKHEQADKGDSGNLRFRLEWYIKPNLRLSLSSMFDRSHQGANAYAPYEADTKRFGEIAFDGDSYYRRTLSSTGLGLNFTGKHFQLSYQQSLQFSDDKLKQDQDFTSVKKVNSLIEQKQLMTSGELIFKNQVGEHYRATTGSFGFYQHIDKDVATIYQKFTSHKTDKIPTCGVAFYHQSVWDQLGIDGLSLTLGIRYDYERAVRTFFSWKDEAEPKETASDQDFSQLVPKVAIQYMFPNTGQIYVSVAKGYKTGGFNTSFNHDDERSYGPEDSWNYEVGAKHPFWNKRLNAEIAVFWIDWSNQQIQQKVDAGGMMIRNAGRSVSRGIECSLYCNPINGLMVSASYGFTHAKFNRYRYSESKDYGGNFIPMVPQHTVSGSITYSKSIKGRFIDRYQIGVSLSGCGKTYWHEDNQLSQPFYVIMNSTASVTRGKLTLGVWAKNITNASYVAYLFKASAGTFAQPGKPFRIGGNIALTL